MHMTQQRKTSFRKVKFTRGPLFGFSSDKQSRYRAELQRLFAVREKLFDVLLTSKELTTQPFASQLRSEIIRRIRRIDIISRRISSNTKLGPVSWVDRIKASFVLDSYLYIATIVTIAAATLSSYDLISNLPALIESLSSWLRLIVPPAHGAETVTNSLISPRDALRYGFLATITLGFFFALGILGWSNKADARKFAADMIKTILGIYAGMATKFFD
jgi:hypothetical protein